MDFWRLYRLVYAKRWHILGLALLAALVIVLGTTIQYQRAGVVADARLTLQESLSPVSSGNGSPEGPNSPFDPSKRISELVAQLRNSNDLYLKAAELLRLPEEERVKEVQRILERNNYFAPLDTELADMVDQKRQAGELRGAEVAAALAKAKEDRRKLIVTQLAAPRDKEGDFARAGLTLEAGMIADIIRQQIEVFPVTSLLDTDNQHQFDNQVQLVGHFQREAESVLYLNMLCVAFINDYAVRNQSSSNVRIAELEKQRVQADLRRGEAVRALAAFKRRGEFEALLGQDATGQNLVTLDNDLTRYRAERDASRDAVVALQAEAQQTPKEFVVRIPASENPRYRSLQAERDKAAVEVERLSATKGDNDPDLLSAKEQLRKLTQSMTAAQTATTVTQPNPNYLDVRKNLAAARYQLAAAEARLKPYENQYRKFQLRLSRAPGLQAEYASLMRNLDLVEKQLSSIEQQLLQNRITVNQAGRAGTVLITSRAHVLPSKNTVTNQVKLLIYGVVLSALLGVALVIGLDALDNKVRTRSDAEQLFGLPVAGEIPSQLPDPRRAPRIAYLDPLSPTAEAYRLLRTDILFTMLEHPFRSLLVTTCKPGQGATTTLSNLAIALAQAGKRVILVDADLRHPRLHEVFALSNDRGLTTLLSSNQLGIEDALQTTEIDNLLVLTAGPLPLNPSELVSSPQMRELHERLRAVADVVLYDSPSAIAFSDTVALSSFVEATLLVIKAGDVPRGVVDQVKARLSKARANIIGVVLNDAPVEAVDSVHYHNQYYPRLKAKSIGAREAQVSGPALPQAKVKSAPLPAEDDEEEAGFLASEPTPVVYDPGEDEDDGEDIPRPAPKKAPAAPTAASPKPAPAAPPPPRPSVAETKSGDDDIEFEFDDDDGEFDDDFDDYDEEAEAGRDWSRTRRTPARSGGWFGWIRKQR